MARWWRAGFDPRQIGDYWTILAAACVALPFLGSLVAMIEDDETLVFEAVLWRWTPQPPAKASWYFVTLTGDAANMVRMRSFERRAAGQSRGFGSVPVRATIGGSDFSTSLFPHKESEGYLLPIKADVRRREDIGEGDMVTVSLRM